MKIHFLNVGHGDCCIVEFDSGRLTVIDINRSSSMDKESMEEVMRELLGTDSMFTLLSLNEAMYLDEAKRRGYNITLTDPIPHLKHLGYNSVFRFISTHPHMDYFTGLDKMFSTFSVGNFWVVNNEFMQDESKLTKVQKNDWLLYKAYRDSVNTKVNGVTIVRPLANSTRSYWKEDGIKILAPTTELISKAKEPNDVSYVLMLKYGKCKIVLGGDAEEATWQYIVDNHPEEIANATILKASHHGRDSGYHRRAVKLMSPHYTVVSVGKKPDTDASNKYRQYSGEVLSTRWQGNITFTCYQDGRVCLSTEHER